MEAGNLGLKILELGRVLTRWMAGRGFLGPHTTGVGGGGVGCLLGYLLGLGLGDTGSGWTRHDAENIRMHRQVYGL